jgi:hypothetical protein
MKEASKKIVVSNLMRCKNKQSFFALHQLQSKIHSIDPSIVVEFHILWDTDNNVPEKQDDPRWGKLIDEHITNLHSYTREFFKNYARELYGVTDVEKFDVWSPSCFIIMSQYLRRVKLYDYYLIYDDDILINDDFSHITSLLLNKVPFLIAEPMNVNCDKVLLQSLVNVCGMEFYEIYKWKNPNMLGFNAGFQGIDLSIYDNFLSVDRFNELLKLFTYKSGRNEDGIEFFGPERYLIDTQQQSFFSLANIVLAKQTPYILDMDEYYVVPNWGTHPVFGDIDPTDEFDGWGVCLKSKISHFIGHTHGKGKPKIFLNMVDKYLIDNGFGI